MKNGMFCKFMYTFSTDITPPEWKQWMTHYKTTHTYTLINTVLMATFEVNLG